MSTISKTELLLKENLKRIREQRNLTPYALSKQIGIDSSQYYRLENKEYHNRLNFEILERIAAFYQIEFYELFKTE